MLGNGRRYFRFMEAACAWPRMLLVALVVIVAVGLISCAQQPERAATTAATWAQPTSTMRWNEYACDLIDRNQVGQFAALRTLAYMNLAINNAMVTAKGQGKRTDGAAAGAAATVLVYLYPKDEAAINARLAGEVAAIGNDGRAAFQAGVDAGRATGTDIVAMVQADRTDLAWNGSLPDGPGKWSSRMQPARPPLLPRLGESRTFFVASVTELRAPAPLGLDSPEFRAQLAEVRRISDTRTNEQIRIAQYWDTLSGSFNAGLWNQFARNAIAAHGLDEATSARLLAQMHMAGVDANIVCHDSKYFYWVPRPTQMDPEIRLAITLPNHPSYPSNHSCVSGAFAAILDNQFPDEGGRYRRMANEAGDSRIYGGLHYRMDVEQGAAIARKVSDRALAVGVPTDKPFTPVGK